MPTVDVYNTEKKKVGEVELADTVFGTEVKEHLFYAAVRYQMAARRSGTHATKGRTQVSGGGKKPYRQKGTGNARQGSRRSVQFVGGGRVHGPQPRDYGFSVNKKARRAALRSVLSQRFAENNN